MSVHQCKTNTATERTVKKGFEGKRQIAIFRKAK